MCNTISLSEALKECKQLMERAEKERIQIAEKEAEENKFWED